MLEITNYTVDIHLDWNSTLAEIANCLYQILSANDNRFTYTSGTDVITVDNKFNLVCSAKSSSSGRTSVQIDITPINDTSDVINSYYFKLIEGSSASSTVNSWVCTLMQSDNMYYLSVRGLYNGSIKSTTGGVFYWHVDNGHNYFGIISNGASSTTSYTTWSIETMLITCPENYSTTYQIRKFADYKLNNFDLFFAPISVMSDVSGEFVKLEELCSCSNVTYRNTISTNNKNYYALGTNTLIELPEGS
jgi:hypothetical protein